MPHQSAPPVGRTTSARDSRGPAVRLRAGVNWLNGSTLIGLAVARAGRASIVHGPRGLWLASGYRLRFPAASAFTVGSVLISAGSWDELSSAWPDLPAHEESHTWQYALLGWLFLPSYLGAMGWSWMRTGDRAARNVFERRAGLARGGYADVPVRRRFRGRVSG